MVPPLPRGVPREIWRLLARQDIPDGRRALAPVGRETLDYHAQAALGRARFFTPRRMKTYVATPTTRQRNWLLFDADGVVLGRLATEVADALRGKRKPEYTPHCDTGDFVVVVNAAKVRVTGNKLADKRYYRHSGYPGGLRSRTLAEMLERRPEEVIRKAVKGMLPRNRLGRQQLRKLKVYAGPEHPHEAQRPEAVELPG
jgi:large subunit ribosomal protein L13